MAYLIKRQQYDTDHTAGEALRVFRVVVSNSRGQMEEELLIASRGGQGCVGGQVVPCPGCVLSRVRAYGNSGALRGTASDDAENPNAISWQIHRIEPTAPLQMRYRDEYMLQRIEV